MELQLRQLPRAEDGHDPREGAKQCSVAVSGDGSRWMLLNASPDLRAQISSFPELLPKNQARGTSIASVLLTDAELDHVTGLLSLRENQPIRAPLHAAGVPMALRGESGLQCPHRELAFQWKPVENRVSTTCPEAGLTWEAVFVTGKIPTYVKTPSDLAGSTVAYKIGDDSSMLYVPAIKRIDEDLVERRKRMRLHPL